MKTKVVRRPFGIMVGRPMVRYENHNRVVLKPAAIKRSEHDADLVIGSLDGF